VNIDAAWPADDNSVVLDRVSARRADD